jgi:hypothetical protein
MRTSPNVARSGFSLEISDLPSAGFEFEFGKDDCFRDHVNAMASSRVMPELIVPLAISSRSRFISILLSSYRVRIDGGKACQ